MTDHQQPLVAYLATLAALVIVFIAALIAGAVAPALLGKFEAFALGNVTGGLIGVLRLPSQRSVTVDNQADDPVPTRPGK